MQLPRHEAGLYLTHNEHRDIYQPLAQWLDNRQVAESDWVSEEQRLKALAIDSCWCLQWYPNTPVGFCILYAADLDVLLTKAAAVEREDA